MGASLVVGGTNLLLADPYTRAPLHAGRDGDIDAPFGRVELRQGRRLGRPAAWVGASGSSNMPLHDASHW